LKWQTKTLAVFIAATVPVEKAGDVNPLLDAAKSIGDPVEENSSTATAKKNTEPFDPEAPPEVDNGDASFERFMTSFGSPKRWAGH
jgi:hypothetical protein